MTEAEWLASEDPVAMLQFLFTGVHDRRLRLFACACCRRVWHLMQSEQCQPAVEFAERFADGFGTDEERSSRRRDAHQATQARGTTPAPTEPRWLRRAASAAYYSVAGDAAKAALGSRELAVEALIWREGGHNACDWRAIVDREHREQSSLIRDIFGNPFRPVSLNTAWLTSDVVALARGIYDERAFDRMPILADALQDAGCENDDILNHCRDEKQTHVRGCWVVDLLLGKS
jgi:hypothetical protein